MVQRPLEQAFHCARHLLTQPRPDLYLMFAAEADDFVEQRGGWQQGILAQQSPKKMKRLPRSSEVPRYRIQIEFEVRSDESLTPANHPKRESIEQDAPGKPLTFENADQGVYRGVTPVKSLGRVVERRLARNREKAANWSGRIGIRRGWLPSSSPSNVSTASVSPSCHPRSLASGSTSTRRVTRGWRVPRSSRWEYRNSWEAER